VKPGLLMQMEYLPDLDRYDRYRRGDLSPLWAWLGGTSQARELTGLDRFWGYTNVLPAINLFRAFTLAYDASVFDQRPQLMGETDSGWWEENAEMVLRQARRALVQQAMTGYGGLAVENRVGQGGVQPVLIAPEMAGYIPIVDPVSPDLVLGHVLMTFWWDGPRVAADFANRVTAQVWVSEEQAALSDGRIPGPVNRRTTYGWNSSNYNGVLGQVIEDMPGRLTGLEIFGYGDSMYELIESLVALLILKVGTANAALFQQALSVLLLPRATIVGNQVDEDGKLVMDAIRPVIHIDPIASTGSGNAYGWVEGPGAEIASALEGSVGADLQYFAMLTGMGPEFFGQQGPANESGEHRLQLLQTAKTRVIDQRVDMGMALDRLIPLMEGGPADPQVAWKYEPFETQIDVDDRVIKLHGAGLISTATAQEMANLPVEDIEQPGMESEDGVFDNEAEADSDEGTTEQPPSEGSGS